MFAFLNNYLEEALVDPGDVPGVELVVALGGRRQEGLLHLEVHRVDQPDHVRHRELRRQVRVRPRL